MANNEISFLGIIAEIVGFFKRRRARRRFLRRVEDANDERRRVIPYNPAPIEAYVSRSGCENIVVSGDNDELRGRLVCAAAYNAHRNNRPVIVLHDGNRELIERMEEAFENDQSFYQINENNKIYNPFAGRNSREVSDFIVSTAGTGNSMLNRSSVVFIDAITLYLETRGIPLTLSAYIDCIKNREYDQITDLARAGLFPENIALLIANRIRDARADVGSVDAYFGRLETELYTILAPVSTTGVSIKNAIARNGVVMVDVSSNSSNMLNIIIQEIKDLISKGQSLSLMLESISIDENEAVARELRNLSSKCNFVYSAQDVYAGAQGNERLITTMVGKSNVYALHHSSGLSAEQFSRYFGEYDKLEVSENYHEGSNMPSFGSGLPGSNYGNGIGTQHERRRKVEENDINDLGRNQAYIKLIGASDIISASFREGNCMIEYEAPQRAERRRNRDPINWLLFTFLIIWSPPLGLIYLMVKSQSRRTKIICGVILGALVIASIVFSIVYG